jgi:hypothetical protein
MDDIEDRRESGDITSPLFIAPRPFFLPEYVV